MRLRGTRLTGMDSEQFKAFREAQKLTQTELANALGISRESVTKYERGVNPVPKPVELACAALKLGVESYDGGALELHRYRVIERYGNEIIECLSEGWRSRNHPIGIIGEWFKFQDHPLADDGTFITTIGTVAFNIETKWR